MPTSDGKTFGFKYVNGHPGNTRDGLQTVTGFGVLSNLTTGYPLLVQRNDDPHRAQNGSEFCTWRRNIWRRRDRKPWPSSAMALSPISSA